MILISFNFQDPSIKDDPVSPCRQFVSAAATPSSLSRLSLAGSVEWLDAYSEIMTEPDLVALALPEDDDIDAVTVTRDSLHRRHVTPRGQSFRYLLFIIIRIDRAIYRQHLAI